MENLVDITGFEFDFYKPQKERMTEFMNTVKNPYRFKCNGFVVQIDFAGKTDFETCLAQGLENSK